LDRHFNGSSAQAGFMNKQDAKRDWKKAIGKLLETWEALAESEAPIVAKKKHPRPRTPKRPSPDDGVPTGNGALPAPAVA